MPDPVRRRPYLVHHAEKGRPPERIALTRFPFRIGRSKVAELTINAREISGFHAQIELRGPGEYVVSDLGSRNGTFVNGERVQTRVLEEGAIIHVASAELRFTLGDEVVEEEGTIASPEAEQQQLIREANDLERVLAERAVSAVFQPIVRLDNLERVAYETLGRPALPGATFNVGRLITMAVARGEAARLSRLMREVAIADLRLIPETPISIFFNLHPAEMVEPGDILRSLAPVQKALGPGQKAVLEIHESAVTDIGAMREIANELRAIGIGLAYDDFGAGQSRLMELVEVPPDYLKLDMGLVRNIDKTPKRQELVRALVTVMLELGICVLAEGIERQDEGIVCRDLGCTLGQGYFYGRPARAGA